MANRLILIMIFSFFAWVLSAQTNISLDDNCLRENTAIFSQTLIELKGERFVSDLLDDNVNFSVICIVDSLGTILSLEKIRSRKILPKELKDEIISFLEINPKVFSICYEKPLGITDKQAYNLIKENLSKENKITHLINIGFPGDLMALYQYERDKAKEKGLCLSKYEYLISMINKYKPQ